MGELFDQIGNNPVSGANEQYNRQVMTKATVYFPDDLMRDLRKRAAESDVPLSQIVADAVRQRLTEDAIDIAAYEARKHEPSLTIAEVRKQLKARGGL